jgi:competence protein ComEA
MRTGTRIAAVSAEDERRAGHGRSPFFNGDSMNYLRAPITAKSCRQRFASRRTPRLSFHSRTRLLPRSCARSFGIALLGTAACMLSWPAAALDVNTATAEQLEAMHGLGPKTARMILMEKARGGNFESLDDLSERVRGIGEKKKRVLQASGLTAHGSDKVSAGGSHAAPATGIPILTDGAARSILAQHPDRRRKEPGVRRPR